MRPRAIRDDIQNGLDFLMDAELALYINPISFTPLRVSWHSLVESGGFLLNRGFDTVEQYRTWVRAGSYSTVLRDGSLLQLTYDFDDGEVAGHRLAYVPCPVEIDQELLAAGEPIDDVVSLYLDNAAQHMVLRSSLRFDYDPVRGRSGHPAAHFSINSEHCRIACVAPVHPYRFIDFVFSHFYPAFHAVHYSWFGLAGRRHMGRRVLAEEERSAIHLSWAIDDVA